MVPNDSDWAYSVTGLLIEDLPLLTTAHIRPYVIATLLHRGAVSFSEVLNTIAPHCSYSDLRVGAWDPVDEEWCEDSRLEKLVNEVLGEMVSDGTLRYNDANELWVLTSNNLSMVISWVASLGGRMPAHLLSELGKDQISRLPESVYKQLS